jgi:Immunity protein 27
MTRDSRDLRPEEVLLEGEWIDLGSRVVAGETSVRIRWLVESRLGRIQAAPHGAGVLFRDPYDGRYWELTYPHPELPQGGPPRLELIDADTAAVRYPLDRD